MKLYWYELCLIVSATPNSDTESDPKTENKYSGLEIHTRHLFMSMFIFTCWHSIRNWLSSIFGTKSQTNLPFPTYPAAKLNLIFSEYICTACLCQNLKLLKMPQRALKLEVNSESKSVDINNELVIRLDKCCHVVCLYQLPGSLQSISDGFYDYYLTRI